MQVSGINFLNFYFQAGTECTHSPKKKKSASQFYQVLLNMQKYYFCDFKDIIFVMHCHPCL